MDRVAPKGRKHLSADALFRVVRTGFGRIPDHRSADVEISLVDALMSGFALFSLKSPSLLAFDEHRADGNLETLYGITRVPCDTQMRKILDPVSPEGLRPVFKRVFTQLQRGKALAPFVFLEGCYLLALDGTGYFASPTIHCAACLQKVQSKTGQVTYSHHLLGAALLHPDCREVIPLMPEPIVKQDGTTKNDCERTAAKRLVAKLRQDHPHLKLIVTEDSLSANAPHIETLQAQQLHYILGVKEGDHAFLFEHVRRAEQAGQVSWYEQPEPGTELVHRFRFVNQVPLNASHPELRVNFLEYWELNGEQVQHFCWVTDLRVTTRSAYSIMRGGRARWKIENETFNTLKNQGYHFEHNYGHGQQNLSVVFALLMMLAFLVDQAQQLCCPLFRAVWAKLGSKRRLWEELRVMFAAYTLASMRELLEALFYGVQKPRPRFVLDSS